MYCKGMEPSELLDHDTRLVATIHKLPFQRGRPLSSIPEEEVTKTFSVSSSGGYSLERKIYMASLHNVDDDEPGIEFDDELLDQISPNENSIDVPQDEDAERRRI